MSSVLWDPGHGGKFNNAVGKLNGKTYLEKDLTLSVCLAADAFLNMKALTRSYLTRYEDKHFASRLSRDLQHRVDEAAIRKASPFVSMHFNGFWKPGAHGVEVYHHPDADESTKRLAKLCLDAMATGTEVDFKSRGVKTRKFYLLRKLQAQNIPAVLVEGPFLTNPEDMAKVAREGWITQAGEALAKAVLQWRNEQDQRQSWAL